MNITFKDWNIPSSLLDKIVVVNQNYKGKKKAYSTNIDNGIIISQINEPGEFYLDVDTTAPKINFQNYNKSDLSGIKSYNGFVDEKWILLEYDAKNDMLNGSLEQISLGQHEFKLIVKDNKNNIAETTVSFKK